MKVNRRYLQIFVSGSPHVQPLSRRLPGAIVLSHIILLTQLVGCSVGINNADLANVSGAGLTLMSLAGDKQSTPPNELFKSSLVLQVTDEVIGKPLNGITIQFTEVTQSHSAILTPAVQTDSTGIAQTQIRAPSSFGQSIQIIAQVKGTTLSKVFELSTPNEDKKFSLKLATSHELIETAGVPFQYIVTIVDQNGNLYSSFDQILSLNWSTTTAHSWAWDGSVSTDYKAAPPVFVCQFNGGVCVTPANYTLTDTTQDSYIQVVDPTGNFLQTSQAVSVLPDSPSRIILTNLPKGPKGQDGVLGTSDDASPLTAKIITTTDETSVSLSTAMVDAFGNYLQDASSLTWALSQESPTSSITPYLSSTTTPTVQITPSKVGSAILTATSSSNSSSITAGSVQVLINPGLPSKLQITTEHSSSETAGSPFNLVIQAQDVKGNVLTSNFDGTGGLNGSYPVALSFNRSTFTPDVSQGCNRFQLNQDNTYSSASTGCGNRTLSLNFSNGVATSNLKASLNYSFENYATLQTVSGILDLGSGSVFLSGTSSPITVSRGPPSRIELHTLSTNSGSFLLSRAAFDSGSIAGSYHWIDSVGASGINYYSILTDQAGNYISNPSVSWTGSGSLAGEFSAVSGNSSIYTPTQAGAGTLVLSGSGVTTTYNGFSNQQSLDHFLISFSDGIHSNNQIDVTKPLSWTIQALDVFENPVNLTGAYHLNFNVLGASNSPLGTSPLVPLSASYTFTNGQTTITTAAAQPLRLPNSSNSLQVSVSYTDSSRTYYSKPASVSGSASGTTYSTPTLLAGSPQMLQIKSAGSNLGTNYTLTPSTLPSGSFPSSLSLADDGSATVTLNVYDSEGNFLNSTTSGTWSWSSPSKATLGSTSPSPTLTLQGLSPGTGTLSVSYVNSSGQTLNAASSTVTITTGTATHIQVLTQNAQTENAGVPFTVTVQALDIRNQVAASFSGAKNLSIQTLNTHPTAYFNPGYTKPIDASFTFSNGQVTLPTSLSPSFILYNSADSPVIQITVPDGLGGNFVGSTSPISVINGSLDHLELKSPLSGNTFLAGSTAAYTLNGIDFYGNLVSQGSDASRAVGFSFTSSLAGQNIASTSLTSSVLGTPQADLFGSVSGNLSSGTATIQVTATQVGTLTGQALPTIAVSSPRTGSFYDPLTVLPNTVISSVGWSPAPASTYTVSNTTPMTLFKATLLDTYGNLITSNNSTQIVLSRGDGSADLTGTLTQTCVGGIATFSDIKYPRAESISLIATALGGSFPAGVVSQSSLPQTITSVAGTPVKAIVVLPGQIYLPGAFSASASLSGTVPNQTAGVPMEATLRVVDDGYNTVTSNNSSATYSITDGAVTPVVTSLTNGTKTLSITPYTAGTNQTITPIVAGVTNVVSSSYTVVGAPPTQLVITSSPQTLVAGACSTAVTVLAKDTYNNVSELSATASTTIALGSSSVGGLFYSDSSCANPITSISVPAHDSSASFYFKDTVAATATLTVSSGLLVSATQAAVIQHGSPTQLSFTQSPPSNVTAQANVGSVTAISPSVQVTAKDTYNNITVNTVVSISVALSSNPTSLAGTLSLNTVNGVATFSDLSISRSGSYTLIASATGTSSATSSSFAVDCVTSFTDNSSSQFITSGTITPANSLIWDTPRSAVALNTPTPGVPGTLKSRVLNSQCSNSIQWNTLAWKTALPNFKEIPNNGSSESTSAYSLLPTNNLLSNNILLMHFNEASWGSSNAILDGSNQSNHGTANVGATLSSSSRFGKSASFNASSTSMIQIRPDLTAGTTSLNFVKNQAFTVAAWIYINSVSGGSNTEQTLFSNFDPSSGSLRGFSLSITPNHGLFQATGTAIQLQSIGDLANSHKLDTGTTQTDLIPGKWWHIAATYNGVSCGSGGVQFYVNGSLEGSSCASDTLLSSAQEITNSGSNPTLGARPDGTQPFNGLIDEFAVWSRTLSSSEILSLYKRSANTIKLQVRTWTSSSHSGCTGTQSFPTCPNFVGPDGTSTTYYTELLNTSSNAPSITLTDGSGNNYLSGQYLQYQAILDTESASSSPELQRVSVSGQ